jgi:hypothetical protein
VNSNGSSIACDETGYACRTVLKDPICKQGVRKMHFNGLEE